jgi:bifunctional aspartokinase / homoserine dehydrogenase 1
MTNPLRDGPERIELRTKINSDICSESAPEYVNESAFALRSSANTRTVNPRPSGTARTSGLYPAHVLQPRLVPNQLPRAANKPLQVMKFGGTSVDSASCIQKVVDIITASTQESEVVVVVSAMGGVTNKLVDVAIQSAAGNPDSVAKIFEELRKRHEAAANALIHSAARRQRIGRKMQEIFEEGERLSQQILVRRELTLQARDAISSLGERLSAPILSAALEERGVPSESIEATELIITEVYDGAPEPRMDLTRERCEARVRPLLLQGVVPVVTGFIATTIDGVLTTLGRNSSDYSGTIMGAALDADEVTLWTDVDGILTTDPRLVPSASSILEMSYREASDLAALGAKVLHPKTLRALMQSGIPLSIRNTFAPHRPGTKITANGSSGGATVKAVTASSDVALITVRTSSVLGARDILRRALAAAAAVPVEVRMLPQSSSSENEVCVVVASALAEPAVAALRHEFAHDLERGHVESVTLNETVAIVTVVGRNMRNISGIVERSFGALGREGVNIFGLAQPSSGCSVSFVVAHHDMKAALITIHRELRLSE